MSPSGDLVRLGANAVAASASDTRSDCARPLASGSPASLEPSMRQTAESCSTLAGNAHLDIAPQRVGIGCEPCQARLGRLPLPVPPWSDRRGREPRFLPSETTRKSSRMPHASGVHPRAPASPSTPRIRLPRCSGVQRRRCDQRDRPTRPFHQQSRPARSLAAESQAGGLQHRHRPAAEVHRAAVPTGQLTSPLSSAASMGRRRWISGTGSG